MNQDTPIPSDIPAGYISTDDSQSGSVYNCWKLEHGDYHLYSIKQFENPSSISKSRELFANALQLPSILGVTLLSSNYLYSPFMKYGDLHHIVFATHDHPLCSPTKSNHDFFFRTSLGIALTLQCLHDRGLMYRDLKPGNIVFNELQAPFLIDCETLRLVEGNRFSNVGSGNYTDIHVDEHNPDRQYSSEIDIYSFGMLLFTLLAIYNPALREKIIYQTTKHDYRFTYSDLSNFHNLLTEMKYCNVNPTVNHNTNLCLDIIRWCTDYNQESRPVIANLVTIFSGQLFPMSPFNGNSSAMFYADFDSQKHLSDYSNDLQTAYITRMTTPITAPSLQEVFDAASAGSVNSSQAINSLTIYQNSSNPDIHFISTIKHFLETPSVNSQLYRIHHLSIACIPIPSEVASH